MLRTIFATYTSVCRTVCSWNIPVGLGRLREQFVKWLPYYCSQETSVLYHHQWTSDSGPGGHCDTSVILAVYIRMGFQSRWKLLLYIFGPSVMESRLRADRHWFILDSLSLSVAFFSVSRSLTLALTHVSTDPQVMTSHLQQLGTKRWRASQMGAWQFYSADAEIFGAFLLHSRDH